MCILVEQRVRGVMRKAHGCSVLCRYRMGSATLCRVGCFGGRVPMPSTLSRQPVPGKPWDAQCSGVGGKGLRAGSLTGLGMLFGVGGGASSR